MIPTRAIDLDQNEHDQCDRTNAEKPQSEVFYFPSVQHVRDLRDSKEQEVFADSVKKIHGIAKCD